MPAGYVPAKLAKSQVDGSVVVDFDTDTIKAMVVVVGGGLPSTSKTGVQYVSDVAATNAEVSGTGYARVSLTGLTVAFDGSLSNAVDWSFSTLSPAFSQNAAGFSNGRYIVFYKDIGGVDSARPVVHITDPGVTLSVLTGQIDLSSPAGGAIQWTVP